MRILKIIPAFTLLIVMLLLASPPKGRAQSAENKLPANAAAALAAATDVTLYSLDSIVNLEDHIAGRLLYGNKILGAVELKDADAKKAAAAFQDAVNASDGAMTHCFEPHHALRLTANGHTYSYLLCYKCSRMDVYEDEQPMPIASLGAGGSPDIVNGLLTAAHVPLSSIYSPEYIAAEKKRREDQEAARQLWIKNHAH